MIRRRPFLAGFDGTIAYQHSATLCVVGCTNITNRSRLYISSL